MPGVSGARATTMVSWSSLHLMNTRFGLRSGMAWRSNSPTLCASRLSMRTCSRAFERVIYQVALKRARTL